MTPKLLRCIGWLQRRTLIGRRADWAACTAKAIVVHVAQAALRLIKVLRCSQPIQRKSLGVIQRNASWTIPIKQAEHVRPVSAALP